jgi:integrase
MTQRRGHGEGSIYKRRDGRWAATVDLGWEGGKRKRKYIYGPTRAEVARKLRAVMAKADAGVPLPDERRTVEQYLLWWANEYLPTTTIRPTTLAQYKYRITHYLLPNLPGRQSLPRLTPEHVDQMMKSLIDQGLGPATRKNMKAVLSSALTLAERRSLVVRNVAKLVPTPATTHRTDGSLSIVASSRLLAASKGDRIFALAVPLGLGVGLRRGELLALHWAQVDFEAGLLSVTQTLSRLPGVGLVLGEPKTARSRRTVPMPSIVVEALRAHRARQAAERLAVGPAWREHDLVLTTPAGAPIDPRNFGRLYHKLCDRAGLPRGRWHATRHTMVTRAQEAGVPLEVISRMVGHDRVSTTFDIYTGNVDAAQAAAAALIDAALRAQSAG